MKRKNDSEAPSEHERIKLISDDEQFLKEKISS